MLREGWARLQEMVATAVAWVADGVYEAAAAVYTPVYHLDRYLHGRAY